MRMLITTLAVTALFAGTASASIQEQMQSGETLSAAVQSELASGTSLDAIISEVAANNPKMLVDLVDVIDNVAPDQLASATNAMLAMTDDAQLQEQISTQAIADGVDPGDLNYSAPTAAGAPAAGVAVTPTTQSVGGAGGGGGGGTSQN